ncbi:MAG TPA: succinate dehydrogenase, cytochrome b556 subunit [Patescibacteria group bacterium]|nr:succinate dehydrogenase, cytochrome b556 subunit [Patescibacteria group bacterium]
MANVERPLSPHLQVYKPQLTSMLSILHRATGAGLAAGAFVVTWWLLAAVDGEDSYNTFQSFAHSIIGQLMLFGWVWAFVYHFLNGIRHMVWDTGRWLELREAYASGWAVFFGSIILAGIIWFAAG